MQRFKESQTVELNHRDETEEKKKRKEEDHRDAVLWTLLVTFFTLLIEEHESSGFFPVRFGFEHILCHRFPLRSSLSSVAFSLSFVARTGQSRHCAGGRNKKNPWGFYSRFAMRAQQKNSTLIRVDPGWSASFFPEVVPRLLSSSQHQRPFRRQIRCGPVVVVAVWALGRHEPPRILESR